MQIVLCKFELKSNALTTRPSLQFFSVAIKLTNSNQVTWNSTLNLIRRGRVLTGISPVDAKIFCSNCGLNPRGRLSIGTLVQRLNQSAIAPLILSKDEAYEVYNG